MGYLTVDRTTTDASTAPQFCLFPPTVTVAPEFASAEVDRATLISLYHSTR